MSEIKMSDKALIARLKTWQPLNVKSDSWLAANRIEELLANIEVLSALVEEQQAEIDRLQGKD